MKIGNKLSNIFCSKDGFDKKYEVKDLYVGLLGIVSCKFTGWDDEEFSFKSVNRYVIYRKKKFNDDYIGQDLFTNREYFFFYETYTVAKAVGGLAIGKVYPLELFLANLGDTVTKTELLALYNQLNQVNLEKENVQEKVTDTILKMILEMKIIVRSASIEEELKEKIILDLEELNQYYIDEMIRVDANKSENKFNFEDEHSIRMEVIKRLIEIEEKLKSPKDVKSYKLKKHGNKVFKK